MPYLLSKLIALLGLGSVIVHSQSMLMGYDVGHSGDWRLPLSPVRIPPQLGTGVAGGWGECSRCATNLFIQASNDCYTYACNVISIGLNMQLPATCLHCHLHSINVEQYFTAILWSDFKTKFHYHMH